MVTKRIAVQFCLQDKLRHPQTTSLLTTRLFADALIVIVPCFYLGEKLTYSHHAEEENSFYTILGPKIELDVLPDKILSFLTRWATRLPEGNFVRAKTVADLVIVIAMFVFWERTPLPIIIGNIL